MNLVVEDFKKLKNLKISLAFKINIFLLCILPFAIISGPALSDIIVSINGLFFIIFVFIHKEFKYIFNKFSFIFFLWCIYLIFLSLNSNYILLSLESSLFYFRFGFFALSTWYILDKTPLTLNFILYSILLCFIMLFIDSIFQFVSGFNLLGFPYTEDRISSFFRDEKVMGGYLSRFLPIFFAISLFLFGNSRRNHLFLNVVSLSLMIIIFLSGERSAFFIYLLFMLMTLLFLEQRIFRSIFIIVSLILVILLSYLYDPIKQRMFDKTIYQLYDQNKTVNIFSVEHQVIYKSSFKMFKDQPIFGLGPKTFREECKKEKYKAFIKGSGKLHGCQQHPHNSYIQLLVETGLVGASILIFLFTFISYQLSKNLYYELFYKKKLYNDYLICFLLAIFLNFFPLIPTGSFFNNWLSIIYYLPFGLLLYFYKSNKHVYTNTID